MAENRPLDSSEGLNIKKTYLEADKRNPSILYSGLLVALTATIFISAMVWSTHGHLMRAHQILLYVGVALITGVLFWVLTPESTGQLDFRQLGIRLGGGAAIGASFMMLAWWLTIPKVNTVIVPIPPYIPKEFLLENLTPQYLADVGELRTVSKGRYIYAEFRSGQDAGQLRIKHLAAKGDGFEIPEFRILLEGSLVPNKLSEKERKQ